MGSPSSGTAARAATSVEPGWILVVFEIEGRRFALPLDRVVEVHRMVAVSPLPEAPDVVEGVIDRRGTVVAVLDVRARFGLPAREVSLDQQLVVGRAGDRMVAIRVDATLGVREMSAGDVDTAATDVPGVRHVAGVTRDDDGIVLVHDLPAFLSWDEAVQLDEALDGLGEGT